MVTVTVAVTKALVLRPLLEDRGRITESIRILVPINTWTEWNRNVFRSRRNESVDRSSFSSVGSLFHACGAATEKAVLSCWKQLQEMNGEKANFWGKHLWGVSYVLHVLQCVAQLDLRAGCCYGLCQLGFQDRGSSAAYSRCGQRLSSHKAS